jgi:DHA1 family multidrug resistance protein-like MFS transporter
MEPEASNHNAHQANTSGSDDISTIETRPDPRLSEVHTIRPENYDRRQSNLNEVELERIETYRLQHRSTVGSVVGITPREQWLPLGAGKPHPPALPDPEEYVVEFTDANDPLHPQNWSFGRKVTISVVLAYTTFVSTFASAIYSSAVGAISANFHISTEVGILGVTLYVLGFASGPTVWAPASELIGRRWPICIGMFGYSLFTIATATSKDVQTLMLTRFFAGFFSASPIAIVPAVFADIYNNQTGAWPSPFFLWRYLWGLSRLHSPAVSSPCRTWVGGGLCIFRPSWDGWRLVFVLFS